MKKMIIFSSVALLAVSCNAESVPPAPEPQAAAYVQIGQAKVAVEIAATAQEQSRGLMYRESMAENSGMLFVFDKLAIHSFWMKNTLIPLDMIWINGNRIADIKTDLPPGQGVSPPIYVPAAPADFVLEVNAGFVKKNGIKVNDLVKIVIPQ